ncbi:hypothetical protein SALBM311S_06103 [Streptomyces alboniger]
MNLAVHTEPRGPHLIQGPAKACRLSPTSPDSTARAQAEAGLFRPAAGHPGPFAPPVAARGPRRTLRRGPFHRLRGRPAGPSAPRGPRVRRTRPGGTAAEDPGGRLRPCRGRGRRVADGRGETQVRRPQAGRPGHRAFVSVKRRQNTIKTTTFSGGQGRMHEKTALRTEGIAEQFRTIPRSGPRSTPVPGAGQGVPRPGQCTAEEARGRGVRRRQVHLAGGQAPPVLGPDLRRAHQRRAPTVIKKMGYWWQLRHRMAEQGMFQTSDLVPRLAERGVVLPREQVYRLVTRPPQRLSMDILVALCDILDCTPKRPDQARGRQHPGPQAQWWGRRWPGAGHAAPLGGPSPRPSLNSPATAQARASDLAAARHQLVAAVRAVVGETMAAEARLCPVPPRCRRAMGDEAFRAQRRLVSRALQIRNTCELLRTCAILWS